MVAVRVDVDEKYPAFYVDRPHPGIQPDVEIPAHLFEELKRCEDALDEATERVARWILDNAPDVVGRVRDDCREIL